jgi:hypothetical protein
MRILKDIINLKVRKKYITYPANIQAKLLMLRQLILDSSDTKLEETLKWNEPSFLCPHGSTIRLGYKPAYPEQFALYFNCKSKLVDTFKELYSDSFKFEGNRAIIFNLSDAIDLKPLQHCIQLALNYHKIKHLPLLGA